MQGVDYFLKDSLWRKQGLVPHHILPPCPHTSAWERNMQAAPSPNPE